MRSRGKVSSWEVTFLRGNGERLRLTKRKVWKRSIVLIVVRRGRQGPLSLVELYYSSRGSDTPTTQVARFAGLSERWGSARAPRRPLGLVPLSKEDGKRKPQAPPSFRRPGPEKGPSALLVKTRDVRSSEFHICRIDDITQEESGLVDAGILLEQ